MRKLAIGNLKMNLLTPAERDRYIESFQKVIEKIQILNTEIVLCPPALHIETFAKSLAGEKISVGAQNCFWEDRGSFTGEISPLMLKNFSTTHVIIGHSERRRYFGETDGIFNAKLSSALQAGLTPVYCIGETADEKQGGKTATVLVNQLEKGLKDVPLAKIGKIILAYEPVWAVGTDLVPNENDILVVKILIKKYLTEKFGNSVAEKMMILYGGSVNAKTVEQVCNGPEMDGVLVGRESLIPVEFLKIAEIIDKK